MPGFLKDEKFATVQLDDCRRQLETVLSYSPAKATRQITWAWNPECPLPTLLALIPEKERTAVKRPVVVLMMVQA